MERPIEVPYILDVTRRVDVSSRHACGVVASDLRRDGDGFLDEKCEPVTLPEIEAAQAAGIAGEED
jgi:hypothetical protein